MDLELTEKVALVTGGSRGIGKAIAGQLAIEGADVAIAARGQTALQSTASELAAKTGRRFLPVVVDTGEDESVRRAVSRVVTEFGRLDILVNCAATPGGDSPSALEEISTEAFWRDVNVKVMGYLRCAQAVAPHMVSNGWGRIISLSGMGARQVGSPVRSIRNAGVVALTKNLAHQLGPHGINVTVVHPGTTRTEGTPRAVADRAQSQGVSLAQAEREVGQSNAIRRLVDAFEVAYVVAFLASPKSVAINGEVIVASGGAGTAIYY